MSPMAAMMMVTDIMPIVQEMVPRTVRPVGAEDHEELVQDVIASAASMLDAMEHAGKPLMPRSVAYYAVQRAKTGRRSYGASRTDVMAAATQLDGRSLVNSMDEQLIPSEDDSGDFCLHDVLSSSVEDPTQEAGRRLDWEELAEDLNERDVDILMSAAGHGSQRAVAKKYHVSTPRICRQRQELGEQVKRRWGEEALADAIREPAWRGSLRSLHEKEYCRAERAAVA